MRWSATSGSAGSWSRFTPSIRSLRHWPSRLRSRQAVSAELYKAAAEKTAFDVLKGTWIRPDGGYTIAIRNVDPNGRLEAMYFNPNPLPFAKAQAVQEGAKLRVSFELRAGGYDGSTYELAYDPASDRLTGTYYQAVAKQQFDVSFVRK